jgi:hypothetical protein
VSGVYHNHLHGHLVAYARIVPTIEHEEKQYRKDVAAELWGTTVRFSDSAYRLLSCNQRAHEPPMFAILTAGVCRSLQ